MVKFDNKLEYTNVVQVKNYISKVFVNVILQKELLPVTEFNEYAFEDEYQF